MRTAGDRDARVTEAFFLAEPRLFTGIQLDGDPDTVTVLCIKKLLTFGCLSDRQHSLARLLQVVRRLAGAAVQAHIDELCTVLDADCARARPQPHIAPATAFPTPAVAAQSIATPAAERSPTVYVCNAPEDASMARRVVAGLREAGHASWVDEHPLAKGDEAWVRAVSEGINNSYVVVVLASQSALGNRWSVRNSPGRRSGISRSRSPWFSTSTASLSWGCPRVMRPRFIAISPPLFTNC